MATRSGALTANTEHAVTYTRRGDSVGITNTGLNAAGTAVATYIIWARVDGTAAVVAADDCYAVLPGQTRWITRGAQYGTAPSVSLIANGAVGYSVEFP